MSHELFYLVHCNHTWRTRFLKTNRGGSSVQRGGLAPNAPNGRANMVYLSPVSSKPLAQLRSGFAAYLCLRPGCQTLCHAFKFILLLGESPEKDPEQEESLLEHWNFQRSYLTKIPAANSAAIYGNPWSLCWDSESDNPDHRGAAKQMWHATMKP